MKYGRVKREHGRVRGLDEVCDEIVRLGPGVTRIVPGRINRRRGTGPAKLTVQYATESGVKCLFHISGTVQEVFIVSGEPDATAQWLAAYIAERGLVG